MRKPRWLLLVLLMSFDCFPSISCSSTHCYAQARPPQPTSQEGIGAVALPDNWRKVDAGPFSILAPPGWQFHQSRGIDSFVGEFVGDGITLTFCFGRYIYALKEEKIPEYVVVHKSIGGHRAKIVAPRKPGHGIAGIYFRNVGSSHSLVLIGRDLTSAQQELVLKIFETLRFGGPMPTYIYPPPPAKGVQ